MNDQRRTTFTLEISTDAATLAQIETHLALIGQLAGVEAVDIELLPHCLRAHLKITLAADNSKSLRRLYNKVCKLANQRPLVVSARISIPMDLFD